MCTYCQDYNDTRRDVSCYIYVESMKYHVRDSYLDHLDPALDLHIFASVT